MTNNIPPSFHEGINQFNQREFYDCHDTLEAIWMDAVSAEKNFYQGILQIAVGLYHLGNSNWRGTVTLLGEGIQRLGAFQPSYANIDVEALIWQSAVLLKALQEAGPTGVEAIAQQLETSEDVFSPDALSYPTIRYALS